MTALTAAPDWRALTQCPDDSLPWALLGYRVGLVDGRDLLLADLADAGRRAAALTRDLTKRPTWAEIRAAQHNVDHQPCTAKCGRCSRCVHAYAWRRRGNRPYLGAEREAQLMEAGTCR